MQLSSQRIQHRQKLCPNFDQFLSTQSKKTSAKHSQNLAQRTSCQMERHRDATNHSLASRMAFVPQCFLVEYTGQLHRRSPSSLSLFPFQHAWYFSTCIELRLASAMVIVSISGLGLTIMSISCKIPLRNLLTVVFASFVDPSSSPRLIRGVVGW
jgi:hypothetical protein